MFRGTGVSRPRAGLAASFVLAASLAWPHVWGSGPAAAETAPLFTAASASSAVAAPGPAYSRPWLVAANPASLAQTGHTGAPRPVARIPIQLSPEEPPLTAILDWAEPLPQGLAWVGHAEGEPLSQVVLVAQAGVLAGGVSYAGGAYAIRPLVGGAHAIFQVDQSAFPPELEPVRASPATRAAAPQGVSAAQEDGSLIDLLVLHTPGATAEAGGPAAMQAMVQLAVTEANAAYTNSGVSFRLRLAHSTEVAYTEAGSFAIDLARLAQTDGYLDEAQALRDSYGADLVTLLVRRGPACGLGYLMAPVSADFAPAAYTVVAQDCAAGYYSLAHELGHNMGSQHDPANAAFPGAFGYSYGYQQPQGRFRTIMAYNCPGGCPRVAHFSNPAAGYQGQPTGGPGADNAQSLNNAAAVVANFRTSRAAPGPTPLPPAAPGPPVIVSPAAVTPTRLFLPSLRR